MNFGKSSRGRSQGHQKIFRAPIYRAHRAVSFAIAQLSCYDAVFVDIDVKNVFYAFFYFKIKNAFLTFLPRDAL